MPSRAVPALPGAQNTFSARADCFNRHASACSRPPFPITRTFIVGGSALRVGIMKSVYLLSDERTQGFRPVLLFDARAALHLLRNLAARALPARRAERRKAPLCLPPCVPPDEVENSSRLIAPVRLG